METLTMTDNHYWRITMRYNRTNFTSTEFAKKLIAAMQLVLSNGIPVYIKNRRGERFLRVAIKACEGTHAKYDFEFFADNGQEVGQLIHAGGFSWGLGETWVAYWNALAAAWELQEHPLVTSARVKQHYKDEQVKGKMRQRGATHVGQHPLTGLKVWFRIKPRILGMFGGRIEVVGHGDDPVNYSAKLSTFEGVYNEI